MWELRRATRPAGPRAALRPRPPAQPGRRGREPGAGGRPGAARARALLARLGAVGARRGRTRRSTRAARQARDPAARSSAGPPPLLLSTPAAVSSWHRGVQAHGARAAARHRRPAWRPAPGVRRPDRAVPRQPRGPQGHSRAAGRLRGARREAARTRACRSPATGPSGDAVKRRVRGIARARPRRAARPRRSRARPGAHAGLRRLLPALVRGAVRDGGARGDGLRAPGRRHGRRGPPAPGPGCGGRKVPPGDPAALAGALAEVLGDPELRLAMGARNRKVVEERFSLVARRRPPGAALRRGYAQGGDALGLLGAPAEVIGHHLAGDEP